MDQERIESIKAGGIAALTGTVLGVGLTALHADLSDFNACILRVAVITVSAFLFGVTFRYIVRKDTNPHLRSGAVGAFALTRSLGQLEGLPASHFAMTEVMSLALPIVESFGLFMGVRLILDWGLQRRWLQPFESE
ncbi:MAG: hypothetical protein AAFY17_17560 [Cyanobacteria bacterium J06642_11]